MEKNLSELGFIEIQKDNQIWFCDSMLQPPDYYGTIIFDLNNKQVLENIRKEYYNEQELNNAIEKEKVKVFKK